MKHKTSHPWYRRGTAICCAVLMFMSAAFVGEITAYDETDIITSETIPILAEEPTDVSAEPVTEAEDTEQQTQISAQQAEVFADYAVYGDVNNDGLVDSRDVLYLQKYIAKSIKFNQTQMKYGDVNEDKVIDSHDVLFVQKYIAKILTTLPYDAQKEALIPRTIKWSSSNEELSVNDTVNLGVTVSPSTAAYKLTLSSSNTQVATVDKNGRVTAKAAGTAVITAATDNGLTCHCTVSVKQAPNKVTLNKTSLSLSTGDTYTLIASVPAGCIEKAYTFTSGNTNVATVNNNGKVTAKGAGSTTVTVKTYNGKTAACAVTVQSDGITSITLSGTASTIKVGNHAYITATTKPGGKSVSWSSSSTGVATVSKGIVTGISAGTATITAKDPNGSVKATYAITVTAQSNMSITKTSASVTTGKTMYLKSGSGAAWSSSNNSVAAVNEKGYITAKAPGVAIITAKSGGLQRTCAVTVTAAAPVRYAYTSPNSAKLNDRITFIAITDKTRDAVQFKFTGNGKDYTVNATSKTTDSTGKNYVWKGSIKFVFSGEYTVTAYSQKNNLWSTCGDGKTSVFISDLTSDTAVSFDTRRPSDDILALNADYEGYSSQVYDDPLVVDTPTLGYGYVISAGEQFYNHISKEEAFALMVNTMNDSSYSSSVNRFMTNNNIKFNQQQFDALVMLVYNLGSGVLSDTDVKSILLNCVESAGSSNANVAYIDASTGLNVRSGPGTSYSSLGILPNGTSVTILEKTTSTWYKVKSSTGITGYCHTDYLTFKTTAVRNMNKVNKAALIGELIQWHHAGGCVWGLLYRRIDELEVFFYRDYIRDGSNNKYNMSYHWNC